MSGGLEFLMFTTFYPPYHFGGDAMGIERLNHALVRRGHRVTVVHDVDAFRMLSGGREPEPKEHPEGLTVHGIESKFRMLTTLATQQLGRPALRGGKIRRIADAKPWDVIVFHNISLIGGPGLLRYGEGLKLYLAHEHWLVCPSHVLWRHNRELCTGRQCLRCVLRYRRPPQYWRYTGLVNRAAKHVDTFVAMSRFSREKHREFGFPREMEVLPYFLPGEEASPPPDPADSPHDRPYFLFVGRLEKIKGLDDVIPVFRDYDGADLLIAGDGTYEGELKDLAAGADKVKFLGRVEPEALERYYRHALALIVPSVCFETFGIILIESFRYRTPVIARRLGPFVEIVEESGGGELFDGPDDLLAAMRRVEEDEPRRREMGDRGAMAWQQLWSEEAVVPRFLEIVRKSAERSGRNHITEVLARKEAS